MHINQKNVKTIRTEYEKLQEEIGKAQKMTQEELKKQRDLINGVLDKKLADIKSQLKAEHDRKKEDNYDFKEREKELNEHLETMTQIA
jgi:signal transduction histidine kinase